MTRLQCQPRFALQEFLPYLLNRAGVKTGLVFGQALQAFGITLSEWRILSALWEQDGLRLNDIAAIVVADVSTTSRQVRALEQAALVARARSGADRRALHLVLTEAGRALTAEILGIARAHERIATQGLSADELATLRRNLVRIFENLDAFEKGRSA